MKKIFSFLLCLLFLFAAASPAAWADGDGNFDNGGGGMGNGEAGRNFWNPGQDGVRVTLVRASDNTPVTTPIDLTNKDESNILYHFGKKSKLHYRNGASLVGTATTYHYIVPKKGLPTIITDNGNANITAIKRYFCSSDTLKRIAAHFNASYSTLINGNYKLLIEPIAYITFGGQRYAMTATEAALYDQKLSGGLKAKMKDLSHKNLPLSMFLEHADMGYPKFTGSRNKAQSDSTIISSLGLGIVKFKESPDEDEDDPGTASYEYRVNTDVITAVDLTANSEINPDGPAKVTFRIKGSKYTVSNIVIPEEESQVVWVKWHTPSSPQSIDINVSSNKGSLSASTIHAKVVSLDNHEPPDPKATDRNDSFSVPTSVTHRSEITSRSWGVWSAHWHAYWVWHEHWVWHSDPDGGGEWQDHGKWKDEGWWDFDFNSYKATLYASVSLQPDDKVPTAVGKNMKSGYGIKINLSAHVDGSVPASHVTGLQTAVSYFPEFQYKSYWRLLEITTPGNPSALQYKKNEYSTYDRRVHFTPLWYPDSNYIVSTYAFDAWTPAGMLCTNLDDQVAISGSVYDDWHIGPKLPE